MRGQLVHSLQSLSLKRFKTSQLEAGVKRKGGLNTRFTQQGKRNAIGKTDSLIGVLLELIQGSQFGR